MPFFGHVTKIERLSLGRNKRQFHLDLPFRRCELGTARVEAEAIGVLDKAV